MPRGWSAIASAAFVCALAVPANAQKTDVVTLANGDHITGEVKSLERGRIEFSTDDIGTIYLEWDKIATLVSTSVFEVVTSNGLRYVGSLGVSPGKSLVVLTAVETVTLPILEVTSIRAIGRGFWAKFDGSLDVGFSYTRSSDIAQLNVNTTTFYRRPAFEGRLTGSGTVTRSGDDDERDDRGTLQASYYRYRGRRWYIGAGGGVETNDSLGLLLRTQVGVTAGTRWVNTNRAQWWTGAGLAVNDERAVDNAPTQNVEAIMNTRASYFSYDRPRTNVDFNFQYFPSLSNFGRQRIQVDSSIKREIWKDVFLTVNVFDSFDSRPPQADAQRNDVGVVLAFGWSY